MVERHRDQPARELEDLVRDLDQVRVGDPEDRDVADAGEDAAAAGTRGHEESAEHAPGEREVRAKREVHHAGASGAASRVRAPRARTQPPAPSAPRSWAA